MPNKGKSLKYVFRRMDPDNRLRELILYISDKCSDDPFFGATKLNKILFFADFHSFHERGLPITGAEYMKLERGPAPRRLVPVREDLISNRELAIQEREISHYSQQRPIPLRKANIDCFTSRDIEIVDEIIKELWGKRADEVSELSHGIAWVIADGNESIPYQASYLANIEVTPDDRERAKEIAREYECSYG